ncbi:hypothetical protein [Saccharicrinis aurantiacus]|uniref:hypothetical protein n=1 Tax=Saccharicrinis aurantiacus TaxID=1849719 RepID=UPI002492E034|nr:hypothetical protein [Saccharicrinis aurantiacus]
MKTYNKLILAFVLFLMCTLTESQVKRYTIKSGKVLYSTTGNGSVMGTSIRTKGTESLYFKDWGRTEIKTAEYTETTVIKMFGKTNEETLKKQSVNKYENGQSYAVDFENQVIYSNTDMAMGMIASQNPESNASDIGEQMFINMGGKKVGKGQVLAYSCDIWEFAGGKQWLYKGIPLKLEMKIMGITTSTVANVAEFDISVPESHFVLPNYPIQESQTPYQTDALLDEMNDEDQDELNSDIKKMQEMAKMSYSKWRTLVINSDEEARSMSEEELRSIYDMMQHMVKQTK